jgi:hypothetical protein
VDAGPRLLPRFVDQMLVQTRQAALWCADQIKDRRIGRARAERKIEDPLNLDRLVWSFRQKEQPISAHRRIWFASDKTMLERSLRKFKHARGGAIRRNTRLLNLLKVG